MTSSFPSSTTGNDQIEPGNLPLLLWDDTTLVAMQSSDVYSYPYSPSISSLLGCRVCPSAGGAWMVLTGQ